MKLYLARYALRNGATGVLHVMGASSWAAIDRVLELFGDDAVRRCSARLA